MAGRPSEAVEFYIYMHFFIFGYLAVFERRTRALETEEAYQRKARPDVR